MCRRHARKRYSTNPWRNSGQISRGPTQRSPRSTTLSPQPRRKKLSRPTTSRRLKSKQTKQGKAKAKVKKRQGRQRSPTVGLQSELTLGTNRRGRSAGHTRPEIPVRLIAFHCLSCTFHCYLTYDPDYFRGADQFPGWDSLCLDPVPDFGCFQDLSPLPNPDSMFAYVRFAFRAQNPCSASDPQSFRVLLVTRTQSTVRRPADRPHSRCVASAQTLLRSYYYLQQLEMCSHVSAH